MSEDLAKQESFQERMKARIRESIGDLITDKELTEVVTRAVDEVFFAPVKVETGFHTEVRAPFTHTLIKELLEPKVREAVRAWIATHEDKINEIVKQTVEQGIGQCVISAFNQNFQGPMYSLQQTLSEALKRPF